MEYAMTFLLDRSRWHGLRRRSEEGRKRSARAKTTVSFAGKVAFRSRGLSLDGPTLPTKHKFAEVVTTILDCLLYCSLFLAGFYLQLLLRSRRSNNTV